MQIRVFRSGEGDCLLITGSSGKHILVDGGIPVAYKNHWVGTVGALRKQGKPLDLVCISHIDRDHIGGILRMLDNEVAWRVHNFQSGLPASPRRRRPKRPKLERPPKIKAIWHNAFLEEVRRERVGGSGNGATSPDLADVFFRNATIMAGAGEALVADRLQFLGQSVGDAIEVSRRIGTRQLKIDHNPEFGGGFVLRPADGASFDVADMKIKVLGPTASEMEELRTEWNKWLDEKAAYLTRLQKKHDRDAARLRLAEPADVLAMVRETALGLAGNQDVTPPNLASIIMLVRDGNDSILLTGDADDPSIRDGLKAAGELDGNGQARVRAFKVPHHGAHNAYSNELARTVIADDYIFSGNGKHDNPEPDVIDGYLKVLLGGAGGEPAALPDGLRPTFWFNCGPELADTDELRKHWDKVGKVLQKWQAKKPNRFRHKLMRAGDSVLLPEPG
jgi:beta-lactamase superfamily II metal-dependent hydrolase